MHVLLRALPYAIVSSALALTCALILALGAAPDPVDARSPERAPAPAPTSTPRP